ncbi:hypothetical protein [Pseudonocardia humida]|uniref:DUF4388 domain-containing protein n=1 Tax=Pseudonocardia humida TaxID=2800819 RepID=A0ABT1A756_9PSEU|nr:hypothetical protein [Pseudonocardia humida]MCO1658664.1 hypothetical protein [Pseudonocardia humida]
MSAPGVGRPTEYLEGGRAIVEALAAAAGAGRTGTAWLMGGNVGSLYFRNGLVVGAELEGAAWVRTMLVNSGRLSPEAWHDFARDGPGGRPEPPPPMPDAVGLGAAEWAVLSREAIVEAAFELLPPSRPEVAADMVFQPDDIPAWTASGDPVEFVWLRREMDRRQSVLDRLRAVVTPESTIARMPAERIGPVQVSAPQWRLLSALSDGATPRSVARRLGAGVFATTILTVQLMRLGMVGRRDRSGVWQPPAQAFPRALFGVAPAAAGGAATPRG